MTLAPNRRDPQEGNPEGLGNNTTAEQPLVNTNGGGGSTAALGPSWSSQKFNSIDGILRDKRIAGGFKLIAILVLQHVREETQVATISDETICDELGSTDRFKCNDCRKLLEKLGWWEVERGHGGRASRYRFKDTNLNWLDDERILRREMRAEERKRRRLEGRSKAPKRSYVVKSPPTKRGRITTVNEVAAAPRIESTVVAEPHKPETYVVKLPRSTVVIEPPVHLLGTPPLQALPSQNEALTCVRTRDPVAAEPVLYRARPLDEARDELQHIVGRGNFLERGASVRRAMGARFEAWATAFASRGLTGKEVATIKAEAKAAMELEP